MALARTQRLVEMSASPAGTGAFTTAGSFTPSDGSLLAVSIYAVGCTDPANLTLAGGSLTWTQRAGVHVVDTGGDDHAYAIFTAPVTTGASMQLAFDSGANDIWKYLVQAYDYTGHDTGSPIGATATGSHSSNTTTAFSMSLSGAPAASSEVLAGLGHGINPATGGSTTEGSGWTELNEQAANFFRDQVQIKTGSTSTTVDWTVNYGTGRGLVAVAIEVKAAATGAGRSFGAVMG